MISAVEAFFLNAMQAEYPSGWAFYMSGQAVKALTPRYMRLWVIPSDEAMPLGLGADVRSRNVGIIQVDIYGPKDRGAGETGIPCMFARNLFHRLPLEVPGEGWVVFKDAAIKDMGDAGEEHRQMMRVPYRYDIPPA
jgi:hypothetical protein